jgi:hypothetical protein
MHAYSFLTVIEQRDASVGGFMASTQGTECEPLLR